MILPLRAAFRSLWRSKRFTFTAILILSLGIGSAALVFSILDAVLLHPAEFPRPESVVEIQALDENRTGTTSHPRFTMPSAHVATSSSKLLQRASASSP
jgi:hypothetical protein